MRPKTDKNAKQRSRVRLHQSLFTLCCFVCVVFAVGWMIHSAGKRTVFFTFSSADSSSRNSSSTASNSSSLPQSDSSSSADSSSVPSADSSDSSESSSASDQPQPDTPTDLHPYSAPKDLNDELDDALFIGDSRTVGLYNNCDRPKATFYCSIGLNIQTCFETQSIRLDNGNMGTVEDALAQGHKFGRVYINFGTNEMGWPYYDSFIQYYARLVQTIRQYSPDAKIYAESILPVTGSRAMQGDAINNENVRTLNEYIQRFANENGCVYLACDSAVADDNGQLPEEASTDGVHLSIEYCKYWLNYIIDNT